VSADADSWTAHYTFFVDSQGRAVLLPTHGAYRTHEEWLVHVRRAETFAVARRMYRALRTSDWSGIASLLAEGVNWTWPAGNSACGNLRGTAQVIVQFRRIARYGFTFSSGDILVSSESFALRLHPSARCGWLVRNRYAALVCNTADGRIHSITTYARLEEAPAS
jgi:ketosteroid isomerase-like protein